METVFHGDGMPEGGIEDFVNGVIIPMAKNVDVIDYLVDAITQEELGGLSGFIASEVEVRTSGALGSDTKGVVEAQIATACRATFKCGTWMCPTPFRVVAC